MSPERRAEIVRILEESCECFHAAVSAVPSEHIAVTPGPDRWSVFQIIEHVAIAENGMFRLLNAATPVDVSLENPEREAMIRLGATSRENPRKSPERAQPTGRFANVSEALNQFAVAREQTIRFAKETESDLFRITAAHPLFGPVNGYELLLIMAVHPRRHADQITEAKRSLA
ncbi:MAG: hypothetical protein QOJ99_43 [Bryobacterales bacterium]|jgi:hypothetical protein|nr:hypothetical protein [Bryobacterales bacterium]